MLDILENLNEDQRKTLKQFRLHLEDLLTPEHTDYVLVKYLRVRSFDLKQALKIFKENYYNRITFGINTFLDTYKKPEVANLAESTGIFGFAKDGSLIRYHAFGKIDFYGFFMCMTCHDLCIYFSYLMEFDIKILKEQSMKTGKDIQEITFILDWQGFHIQQLLHKNVIEMALDFIRLFQDCYPELWSHVLIINAPKVFNIIFNIMKPVIRMATLERIYIADKASTKDLLLNYIDEDVLPVFLGGNRVDSNGDPECKEFISTGEKIPEKFYLMNCRRPLSPLDTDVKCMTIRTRSMGNISLAVKEAKTRIRLQVKSENGSISISVLYREFGLDPNDIEFPAEDEYLDETADNFKYKQISVELRSQVHITQEDAMITLPWPGIYVLRFNNSSNWFTSRKLLVKYEIFPPSDKSK